MVASTSRSAQDVLIEAVNTKSNLALTFEQVSFDLPVMVDPTVVDLTDPAKRNSSVRFTTNDTEQRVVANIQYNRLSLPKLFEIYPTQLPQDDAAVSAYDVLPAIGLQLNLELDPADFQDTAIVAGSPRTVQLKAADGSYVYFGQVDLTIASPILPEEDEMYYKVLPAESNLHGAIDDSLSAWFGSGCGYPTYLQSSDPTATRLLNWSAISGYTQLVLVSAELWYTDNANPGMISSEFQQYAYTSTSPGPSSSIQLAEDDTSYRFEKLADLELDPDYTGMDKYYFKLAATGAGWANTYATNNGKWLVIRAQFTDPNVVDANGQPIKMYYTRAAQLDLSGV